MTRQSTTQKSAAKAAATHAVERGHETRVDELSEERATHPERPEGPWVRPTALDAPEPREGMVQRWVRKSMKGDADPKNWNRAMREGWRPRPSETVEKGWQQFAISASDAGIIQVDDLVLCEMDEKTYRERAAYYKSQADLQMAGVEHDLERSQMPGHPIQKTHNTSVTHPARVVGRKVEAADNE